MIHIISSDLSTRRLQMHGIHTRYGYRRILARMAAAGVLAGPHVLRALVLVLVALMLIFVSLMQLTGHYETGAPVLGSILLIGLGAAQYAR